MMSIFRKLMPREDKFFDMFSEHSRTVVEAAEALGELLNGKDVEANCERIVTLEDRADGWRRSDRDTGRRQNAVARKRERRCDARQRHSVHPGQHGEEGFAANHGRRDSDGNGIGYLSLTVYRANVTPV